MEQFNMEDFNLVTDQGNWAESLRQDEAAGLSDEERRVLNRLRLFAVKNNLKLFNVKGSLYDRVRTITRINGACPCKTQERPHCPCPQAIQECKEKGECFCRVFLAQDWREKWEGRLNAETGWGEEERKRAIGAFRRVHPGWLISSNQKRCPQCAKRYPQRRFGQHYCHEHHFANEKWLGELGVFMLSVKNRKLRDELKREGLLSPED